MKHNTLGSLSQNGNAYLLRITLDLTENELLVGLIDSNEINLILPVLLLPIIGNQIVSTGLKI